MCMILCRVLTYDCKVQYKREVCKLYAQKYSHLISYDPKLIGFEALLACVQWMEQD